MQELAAAAEDLESLADRLAAYDLVLATEVGGGVVPYVPQPYAPQPPVHRVVASAEEVEERPANRNVLLIIAMVITTIPWYMIGLCLTIPLGVLSIVFGNHVRNAIDAGRTDYCRAYAKLARAFSIVVIVFFIICLVLDGILLTVAIFN